MQAEDLFKHSITIDNTPAYRNIYRRAGQEAFDDLLDPLDTEEDSPAAEMALRKANQVRSDVSPVAAHDPAMHYQLAIQNVFQRAVFYPTRYGDGSYPVWYGCMDQLTTIYETAYHMIREEIDQKGHLKPIERQRLVYKVSCTAILIDISLARQFYPKLVDSTVYSFTRQIGKRVRTEMHPGLLVPSARHHGHNNLVIFTSRVLSNPELVESLTYQLDLSSMKVTVQDSSNQVTRICIDGNQWF